MYFLVMIMPIIISSDWLVISTVYIGLYADLSENTNYIIEVEVLTAVVMKSTIFLDITPCSPLKVKQRFRGKYRLYHQGRKTHWTRYQLLLDICFYSDILLGLFFVPEDEGDIFLRSVG
jgi:hypothetical protein